MKFWKHRFERQLAYKMVEGIRYLFNLLSEKGKHMTKYYVRFQTIFVSYEAVRLNVFPNWTWYFFW